MHPCWVDDITWRCTRHDDEHAVLPAVNRWFYWNKAYTASKCRSKLQWVYSCGIFSGARGLQKSLCRHLGHCAITWWQQEKKMADRCWWPILIKNLSWWLNRLQLILYKHDRWNRRKIQFWGRNGLAEEKEHRVTMILLGLQIGWPAQGVCSTMARMRKPECSQDCEHRRGRGTAMMHRSLGKLMNRFQYR